MVHKIKITDNTNSPIRYLPDLKGFENGKEYTFTDGVNVIVGENGSGKTTLLNLIKKYLLVDYTECARGAFGCNIRGLYKDGGTEGLFYGGVDVYADYRKNTFRLSHAGEKERNQALETFEEFGAMYEQKTSSTGEGVVVAINYLFKHMFGKEAKREFDYGKFKESNPKYYEYIQQHRIDGDKWTVLLDEPDRNLSIENLLHIKGILDYEHPQVQLIAVIHNPILIYGLSKMKHVNVIELTDGYVEKVKEMVEDLL